MDGICLVLVLAIVCICIFLTLLFKVIYLLLTLQCFNSLNTVAGWQLNISFRDSFIASSSNVFKLGYRRLNKNDSKLISVKNMFVSVFS